MNDVRTGFAGHEGWNRHGVPSDASHEIVRWGQEPLAFELSTRDAATAARARDVFAPWPAAEDAEIAARFEVRRVAAACGGGEPTDDVHGFADHQGRSGHAQSSDAWEVRAADGRSAVHATADAALRWVELSAIQAFTPRRDGALALHGALVDFDGRALLVVGPGRAGKSSLACALWRAGGALLTDDVTLLDLATAAARPGPRRVALRDGSAALLGDDLWRRIASAPTSSPTGEGWCFHPADVDGRPIPRASRVAAVLFLERSGRPPLAPAELAPIVPARAALALLPYVIAQRGLDPGDAIRRVAPLAERVAAFDLARGPLDEMAAHARAALAEVA